MFFKNHKILIVLLLISITTTLIMPYADVINTVDDSSYIEDATLRSNNRYYYDSERSSTTYATKYISPSQSRDIDTSRNIMVAFFASIPGGQLHVLAIMIGDYIYDQSIAGRVTRESYTVSTYRVHRLSGSRALVSKRLYVKVKVYDTDNNLHNSFNQSFRLK